MKRNTERFVVSSLCLLGVYSVQGTGVRPLTTYAAFMAILLIYNWKILFGKGE